MIARTASPAQVRARAAMVLRRCRHPAPEAPTARTLHDAPPSLPHAELEFLRPRRPVQPCRPPMTGETPLSPAEVLHGVYNGLLLEPIPKGNRHA